MNDLINSKTKELKDRKEYSEKYAEFKAKIIDKLNNWEQTLSTNGQLAIDLNTLQDQYETINNFIDDWTMSKSEINDFCVLGSEYDSILQGFPLSGDQHYKAGSPQRKLPSNIFK